MENKVCGAKTRKGTPCQKTALKNGKCRLHGGKSTGPQDKEKLSNSLKGNKNAVKTGAYETISYDTLTDEEKELYEQINTDPATQVDGMIKMNEIRRRRLMIRRNKEVEKKKPDDSIIFSIEAAVSRIDLRVSELARDKRAMEEGSKLDDSNSPLVQLTNVLSTMRVGRTPKEESNQK